MTFAQEQDIKWAGTTGTVIYGADASVMVKFYKDAATGKDFVHLRFPGDKTYAPKREVKESDKRRWPTQWDAYQNNRDQFEGQTRLEELAWIDEGTRDIFNAAGVFTLEGLAGVPDGNLNGLGHGAATFRERARKELKEKQKAAQFDEQKAQMAALQRQIADLQSQIQQQPAKRGPGRPKKQKDTEDGTFVPE